MKKGLEAFPSMGRMYPISTVAETAKIALTLKAVLELSILHSEKNNDLPFAEQLKRSI